MQHTKSPCCQAPIRRFGNRRRQCSSCLKTWRIHKHRRGRKSTRIQTPLLKALFETRSSVRQLAYRHLRLGPSRIIYRIRKQLRCLAIKPWTITIPPGPLILIVDGFWYCFRRRYWVVYFCAVKPVRSNYAWILRPRVYAGKERYDAWNMVISQLPPNMAQRIKAFVSDGFRGSSRIVRQYGWIHQRCHFHLLAQLYRRQGIRKKTLRQRAKRKLITGLIRRCLTATKPRSVSYYHRRLHHEANLPLCPLRIRQIVREFLRQSDAFRAYLLHPELKLPTTTSCLESYGKELRRYTKKLNTPISLALWSEAYVHYHPKVVCNGKIINQI